MPGAIAFSSRSRRMASPNGPGAALPGRAICPPRCRRATDYDAPDEIYSPEIRRDRGWRARLSYGVPLGTLGGWLRSRLPDTLAPVTLQFAADYLSQTSDIPNFSYR